jgi:hypothetical protein
MTVERQQKVRIATSKPAATDTTPPPRTPRPSKAIQPFFEPDVLIVRTPLPMRYRWRTHTALTIRPLLSALVSRFARFNQSALTARLHLSAPATRFALCHSCTAPYSRYSAAAGSDSAIKKFERGWGMGGKWRASTWGDEITLEYGKALRGYDTTSGKYRVFGSNGPIGWTAIPLAQGPGVILGRKGAYRGIEFSREPFFVIDTAYYVVPKTELDMRWLYYAIKYHKLGEIDDSSPIPSTTRSAVYVKGKGWDCNRRG